jgi:hypothetical protein
MARDPLDKVRKLLALATSGNVHEAAAAAAAAQAIIERYRLEHLLDEETGAPPAPPGEEVLDISKRTRRYKTVLASGLAEANGCLVYSVEVGRERRLVLAGQTADRLAVRSLWDWLVPRLEWLSATHGAGHDKRWHDDFRVGAAQTVVARLRSVGEEELERLNAAALVRLEPALIERRAALQAYASDLNLRRGRRLTVGLDAFEAGQRAAHEVALDRPNEG